MNTEQWKKDTKEIIEDLRKREDDLVSKIEHLKKQVEEQEEQEEDLHKTIMHLQKGLNQYPANPPTPESSQPQSDH